MCSSIDRDQDAGREAERVANSMGRHAWRTRRLSLRNENLMTAAEGLILRPADGDVAMADNQHILALTTFK